jgi:hypothetical protein
MKTKKPWWFWLLLPFAWGGPLGLIITIAILILLFFTLK